MPKLQVRIDPDIQPKVKDAAKKRIRSVTCEVNHRLRKSFGERLKRDPMVGHYNKT